MPELFMNAAQQGTPASPTTASAPCFAYFAKCIAQYNSERGAQAALEQLLGWVGKTDRVVGLLASRT